MKTIKWIISLTIISFLTALLIQNSSTVPLTLFWKSWEIALSLLLLIVAVVGFFLGLVAALLISRNKTKVKE